MGLSNTNTKDPYTGDGSTNSYGFTSKITAESDLQIYIYDSSDNETLLTLTTDYTVDGVNNPNGGTITLVDSGQAWLDGDGDLDTGYSLLIRRIRQLTQTSGIRNQGDFYPSTHESFFDKIVMIAQQIQEKLSRTPKFKKNSTATAPYIDDPNTGDFLAWDSNGNLVNTTLDVGVSAAVSKASSAQAKVGTDDTTFMTPAKVLEQRLDAEPMMSGDCHNLGLYLSSQSRMMVSGKNGSSLSSNYPGYVCFGDYQNGLGYDKVYKLTEDFTLYGSPHASTDLDAVLFGTTAGVAWDQAMPFYIYATTNGPDPSDIGIFISRNPTLLTTPSSTYCADAGGTPSTDSQDACLFFQGSEAASTYGARPCVRIGGVLMTKTAGDDWAITSSNFNGAGILRDPFVGKWFNMPFGQNGAVASSFFGSANAPSWASLAEDDYQYKVNLDGEIEILFDTSEGGNCTNGTDASNLLLQLPASCHADTVGMIESMARVAYGGTTVSGGVRSVDGGNYAFIEDASLAQLQNNDFSNTGDDITFRHKYPAWRR